MQDKKERKPNDPSLRLDGFVPHFFMHVPIVSKVSYHVRTRMASELAESTCIMQETG